MLIAVLNILYMVLWATSIVIIVQAILSWLVAFNVINTSNNFIRQLLYALDRLTRPIYRPIRRLLPDFGGLDLSPIVVLLIIWALQQLLIGAMRDLYVSGY